MEPPSLDSLIERLRRLSPQQLEQVEGLLTRVEAAEGDRVARQAGKDWPHAPIHRLSGKGTSIVTTGTLHKQHFFRAPEMLGMLESELLKKASEYEWHLEAWSVFSNHYHFVGHSLKDAASLKPFLTHLHADTARELNRQTGHADRQVWHNFWETKLTYEKSYFARLNYVHQNPVKHGLVERANQYRWCSAGWFERTAQPAQVKTIYSFKTDKVNVYDDF